MPGEPLWINYDPVSGTPQYDANELRQAMALALMYGGRAVGARQGVRPGGNQLQVSLAGSTITVQPGACCVDPGLTTTQGPYWVAIPVAENPTGGPLAAADATNPRKDIVVGRVYDHDQDASGLRLARSEYRAGAAGPTPSLPAVQAGELLLATIDVPKVGNGAPVVTNVYPYTVASGGLLPVRNQAEEDALATVAYPGMSIWRIDLKQERIHDGTAWRTILNDPGAWTDYSGTFAITATTTSPTKGNSSYQARYTQLGKTVTAAFRATIGSTFVPGSGSYRFSLPVPANSSPGNVFMGSAAIFDSGTATLVGSLVQVNPTTVELWYTPAAGGSATLSHTGPGTAWANGDRVHGSITYEAA